MSKEWVRLSYYSFTTPNFECAIYLGDCYFQYQLCYWMSKKFLYLVPDQHPYPPSQSNPSSHLPPPPQRPPCLSRSGSPCPLFVVFEFCCIFCWGVYGFQGEVFWICLLGLWLSMDLGWWVGDVEPWLCCCTLCTQQICPLHYVHCSKESLFYFYFFCSPL